jgi:hypothetical protein
MAAIVTLNHDSVAILGSYQLEVAASLVDISVPEGYNDSTD